LTGSDAGVVFPAVSRQLPLTVPAPVSGPEYVCGAVQDWMPEVPSVPAKVTPTGALYQPFESAAREAEALAVGAVLSTWKFFVTEVSPPSLDALHVNLVDAVSALSVRVSHPVVERMIDSGSTTDQLTVTFDLYQPASPSIPVMTGVTTGGVGSPGMSGTPVASAVSRSEPRPSARSAARRRNAGS
jgi:hypothetical protein